ncbi:uncharacterized protein F21D5.5-like [Drosophila takahashii]|uniref:uncharacterized protein F21D5.5-like n=1 Tax=Drosophila takahashii TaxID=29030 RepID=UPI001CF84325|nr:uncharacterized protein F21D5.5-like [Drosophila takahashii]
MSAAKYLKTSTGKPGEDLDESLHIRHPFEVVFSQQPTDDNNREKPTSLLTSSAVPEYSDRWDSAGNGKLAIFTSAGVTASEKIAGYDMDGTIIKTKSGWDFPEDIYDWQIIFPEVPEKLKSLHNNGFKICFFTNQRGIARGEIELDDFKVKIKQIVTELGVPIQVFIAIGDGFYRKPLTGMWQHLKSEMNQGIEIQEDRCFFVGDAAGRPEKDGEVTKRREDHSLADRLFAANIGLTFYTPEVHFLGQQVEEWIKPDFDPTSLQDQVTLFEPDDLTFKDHPCEMVIMVGLPGSGKSHFCATFLQSLGYKIINAETLGSTRSWPVACKGFLRLGQSCVVDNTNIDVASRQKFLQVASEMKVPCRCLVMNVPLAQVRHNLAFRELTDSGISRVRNSVFEIMEYKYQEPVVEEGFLSIHKVNFRPAFADEKLERLYKMYLLEELGSQESCI